MQHISNEPNRYFFIEVEGGLLNAVSRAYADSEKRDADAVTAYVSQDPETDTVLLVDTFVGLDGSVGITVETAHSL